MFKVLLRKSGASHVNPFTRTTLRDTHVMAYSYSPTKCGKHQWALSEKGFRQVTEPHKREIFIYKIKLWGETPSHGKRWSSYVQPTSFSAGRRPSSWQGNSLGSYRSASWDSLRASRTRLVSSSSGKVCLASSKSSSTNLEKKDPYFISIYTGKQIGKFRHFVKIFSFLKHHWPLSTRLKIE